MMNMSNLFNSIRFFGLIRRQWISFGRIYLMSIGIIAGVIFGFYVFNFNSFYNDVQNAHSSILNFRAPLFCILGLFFVTVISSSYFANLGRKTTAILELMIPASQLEKFLVGIFYTTIVGVGSYLLIFYLIDFSFVSYLRSYSSMTLTYNEGGREVIIDVYQYFFKVKYENVAYYFCVLPMLLNAIFLLGGILFQNYQYIKTAISLVVFCVAWVVLFIYLMKMQTDNTVHTMDKSYWSDPDHVFGLIACVGVLLTVIFWYIGFLRLKEKEV